MILGVLGLWLWCLMAWGLDNFSPDRFYPPYEIQSAPVQAASEAVIAFGDQGSGFLISPNGYILTNHHIAEAFGRRGIVYRRKDGRPGAEPLVVSLVASKAEYDLALYRAHSDHALPYLSFREEPLHVGESIFLVSHPNRAPQRVSFGWIIAPIRDVGGIPSIEYRLLTGWGSSGAPILDRKGQVVAIHRAWYQNKDKAGVVGIPASWFRTLDWIPDIPDL